MPHVGYLVDPPKQWYISCNARQVRSAAVPVCERDPVPIGVGKFLKDLDLEQKAFSTKEGHHPKSKKRFKEKGFVELGTNRSQHESFAFSPPVRVSDPNVFPFRPTILVGPGRSAESCTLDHWRQAEQMCSEQMSESE